MYIDTHAHLYLEQFTEDFSEVIKRSEAAQVSKIFLPNIDSSTIAGMNKICKEYPEVLYPLIGLHPCSVKENFRDEIDLMNSELENGKYYGIGETGIDLYWDTTFKAQQIEAFEIQIDWAKKYNLPIIIHSREALDKTIELISKNQDGTLTGVFHCFNGNIEQCRKIQEIGFYMGLGGVITYKNAKMAEVVAAMNINNMILETDAPYLSPVPYRGKRNESSYIPVIAEKVSEYRNDSIADIQTQTTMNAKKLYHSAF